MPEREISHRIDLVIKPISFDEESGAFEVEIVPHPGRYQWIEINGKRCLHDKLDNVLIPERELRKLIAMASEEPFRFQRQQIDDAAIYIQSRKDPITSMLKGEEAVPTFEDKSEEFLRSLSVHELGFVILSLDIVGSTKLATSMDPNAYSCLISTVLFELSEVVPKFLGHVLKYAGDGLIAYFPEPSFIRMHDLAIDCALTLRGLVYDGINPVLEALGYPRIDIRIGLDSGAAFVETIGSPKTKQHRDIIGLVVNLATKIQAEAERGGIFMGDMAQRHLHTTWRLMCEPMEPRPNWSQKDSSGQAYRIYRVKLD